MLKVVIFSAVRESRRKKIYFVLEVSKQESLAKENDKRNLGARHRSAFSCVRQAQRVAVLRESKSEAEC